MGGTVNRLLRNDPECEPKTHQPYDIYNVSENNPHFPTFDPMLGFPNGRKKRESLVSPEQMERALMPKSTRDYCAHFWIEVKRCQMNSWPGAPCKPWMKALEHCRNEDYILRMKELERERRLLVRARKKRREAEKREQELLA